jgi:hypothetical protein
MDAIGYVWEPRQGFLNVVVLCDVTVFEPKRDVVRADWRRLHKKELYALYSSPDIIRVIK